MKEISIMKSIIDLNESLEEKKWYFTIFYFYSLPFCIHYRIKYIIEFGIFYLSII